MTLAVDFGTETDSRRTYCNTNFCDKAGAEELKRRLEEFWSARGHNVEIILRETGFHPAVRAARFDVRSDMKNGFPPKAQISS